MVSRDDQSIAFLNSDTVNDDFFIEIVENKLNIKRDQFKLRLVLMSPATGKNENYVSVVYRAKIKIEVLETKAMQSVDVAIKVLLTTLKEFKEFSVFPRERIMYDDVITSFENIWKERADVNIQFGPKCIKIETDPYEIIVLDDLKAEGYQMLNRKVGLNLDEAKMMLAKLAKFHAASAIRYHKDGILDISLDRKKSMPPMPEDSPMVAGFMKIVDGFSDAIKNYGDCNQYYEKIVRWGKMKFMTTFLDVAEPMRNGFTILNHGDAWLNNMMFRLNEANEPLEISLIDYQVSFWGSPSSDLMYFLMTSVHDDVKVDNFDNFIEFYHQELIESLKQLKYDKTIPTLADLHVDLLEKGAFACYCLIFILFIVKYDSSEEINMETLMAGGSAEMMERVYQNKIYKKAIKAWFPFLNKRGFLDTLIVDENAVVVKETGAAVEETVAADEKNVVVVNGSLQE